MRVLVANIPLRRNRFLADLNAALGPLCEVVHSSDDFWAMRGDYDVVHLHWPEYITYEIEAAYNTRLSDDLIAALEQRLRFWSSRSAIVMTRHNAEPYNAQGDAAWGRLYELVFSHLTAVVHMGEASIQDFARRHAGLERRVQGPITHGVIPHHNYVSLVRPGTKQEGRRRLGIPAQARVVLVFGSIRSDSERELILASFTGLGAAGKFLLVSSWRETKQASSKNPFTRIRSPDRALHQLRGQSSIGYGFVAEEDTAFYLESADVLFIPRLKVLNSANVSLGFTFGRVVVGPDDGNAGEILRATGNPVFDPRSPASAVNALAEGLRLAVESSLGESNRTVALTEWAPERCAQLYLELYERAATTHGQRA